MSTLWAMYANPELRSASASVISDGDTFSTGASLLATRSGFFTW